MKKEICIIAGEVSGDLHGAHLVKSIKSITSNVSFWGLGGKRMEEAGVNLLENIVDFAAVGIIESLSNIIPLWNLKKKLEYLFHTQPPHLLILIDYSGFNLKIAELAKKYGIRVVYYIAPQIWAWRKYRISAIRKYVDEVIAVFPFEVELYQEAGVKVSYFGHPLVDIVKPVLSEEKRLQRFGDFPKKVTFLPGSREKEINFVFPQLITLARKLKKRYGDSINLILGVAPQKKDIYTKNFPEAFSLFQVEEEFIYDAITNSDLVISASGTATLETALLHKPLIVVYKISSFTAFILRFLVQVEQIALANIVAGEKVVPEFVQEKMKASMIYPLAVEILERKDLRDRMVEKLKVATQKLGESGVIPKIAQRIVDVIDDENT